MFIGPSPCGPFDRIKISILCAYGQKEIYLIAVKHINGIDVLDQGCDFFLFLLGIRKLPRD